MTKILSKSNGLLMAGVLMAGVLAACSSDNGEDIKATSGTGSLTLQLGTETEFATRALDESIWKKASNYTVEIVNSSQETVKTYDANTEIPAEIELPYGRYTVKAYCGEEEAMSRSTFRSEGVKAVNLSSGATLPVKLECSPTCGKVMVKFDTEMPNYFEEYYVTFATPKMASGNYATWSATDSEPWYLAVGTQGDDVTATIHLKPTAQYETDKTNTNGVTQEGTVVRTYNLKRNKAWTLNISPNYTIETGKLGVSITIDDSTNDIEEDIVIPSEWI